METSNVSNLHRHLGKRGRIRLGELDVDVEVVDVRSNFGRVDFCVRPVAGQRSTWVAQGTFVETETPEEPVDEQAVNG